MLGSGRRPGDEMPLLRPLLAHKEATSVSLPCHHQIQHIPRSSAVR